MRVGLRAAKLLPSCKALEVMHPDFSTKRFPSIESSKNNLTIKKNNLKTKIILILIGLILKGNFLWSQDTITKINNDTIQYITKPIILSKKHCIKIEAYNFIKNNVCFNYEGIIKPGINYEIKLSYYGIKIFKSNNINSDGGFAKFGLKFLIKQEYFWKKQKYLNPFNGRYIKFELTSAINVFNNMTFAYENGNGWLHAKSDVLISSNSLNLIYGRQFILGKSFSIDLFFGLGYGYRFIELSNKEIPKENSTANIFNNYNYGSIMIGFMQFVYTGGLALGYNF